MLRRHPRERVYDVVTPTERERRLDLIARQRKAYVRVIVPCLALAVFGFFVPAPVPARVAALIVAAALLPIAAIVGNAGRR